MIDHTSPFARWAYTALAALAGAVAALGFQQWKEMTPGAIFFVLATGFSFGLFIAPWLAVEVIGVSPDNTRALCGITYALASGYNLLLPTVWSWLKRILGREDVK